MFPKKDMAEAEGVADDDAHMKTWHPTHSEPSVRGAERAGFRSPCSSSLGQATLATLISLVLLPACQRLETRKEMVPPNEVGGAALHAVHSDRLKGIMAGLNGLAFERLPQELDTASRQRTELKRAAAVADELAKSAEQVGGVADEIGLTPEERKVFLALAQQLRTQVEKLDVQANRGELRGVEATMQEMSGTCIACHALFREASPAVGNPKP